MFVLFQELGDLFFHYQYALINRYDLQTYHMKDINVDLLTWSGGTVKNEIISNKELAEELHEPSGV